MKSPAAGESPAPPTIQGQLLGGAGLQPARSFFRNVLAILRELSDETAYRKHLLAHGRKHSSAEWRLFSDERFRAKYARAKCC